MHIFKTSAETFESVISNKKHAFKYSPKSITVGDLVILSKNKKGLTANEKQIGHYAILKRIRETSDEEIEELWPGNSGRWNYITEFTEVKSISVPFNLSDVLEPEQAKRYSSIMTHGRLDEADEAAIYQRIGFTDLKKLPEEIEASINLFEGAKKNYNY